MKTIRLILLMLITILKIGLLVYGIDLLLYVKDYPELPNLYLCFLVIIIAIFFLFKHYSNIAHSKVVLCYSIVVILILGTVVKLTTNGDTLLDEVTFLTGDRRFAAKLILSSCLIIVVEPFSINPFKKRKKSIFANDRESQILDAFEE